MVRVFCEVGCCVAGVVDGSLERVFENKGGIGQTRLMKQRHLPITLNLLPTRLIYQAVLQFTQQQPLPHTKERKPLYPYPPPHPRPAAHRPTHLLSPPALVPRPQSLQPMPAWGTRLSRLQTLLDERWHARLSGRAAQGIAQETPDAPLPTPAVLVDGTGVGFHTPFDAPFRRVRSHRKAVVLVDCRGVGVGWWERRWVGRMRTRGGCGRGGCGGMAMGWWVWGRCGWGISCRGIGVGCGRVFGGGVVACGAGGAEFASAGAGEVA